MVILGGCVAWPLACDSGTQRCDKGVYDGGRCTAPFDVAVNGHGFRPSDSKLGTIRSPADAFAVRRVADDGEVIAGKVQGPNPRTDASEDAWVLDFSELREPGEYYVETDMGLRSDGFLVARDVYEVPLRMALLGLYGQRCGAAVEFEHGGEHYSHGICHVTPAEPYPSSGVGGRKDVSGGWHDAGDYGKYSVNGAFSAAFLLYAWERFGESLAGISHVPGYDDELPGLLAEAAWELDWLVKMQSKDGGVAHQVRPARYEGSIMPSNDTAPRYISQPSSAATADVAAVMALGARLFEAWDQARSDSYRQVAMDARAWLEENSGLVVADQSFWPNVTYGDQSDDDERLWADIEWWRSTRDVALRERLESALGGYEGVSTSWDWQQVANLGVFAYLLDGDSTRSSEIVDLLSRLVVTGADELVERSESHAYGRGVESYYWGSNGVVARSCMNLLAASELTGEPRYERACAKQLGHLLGRNYFGRSQITGLSYRPPLAPHHRPSQADGATDPWPGLLVGGPNVSSTDNPRLLPGTPAATAWFDSSEDYFTNEVAINWNAALVYATAGLLGD